MPNHESISRVHHPILRPEMRELTEGGFSREEVTLANRNAGTLLETLRYDVTPPGLHYLLIHFDVPYVASAAGWVLDIGGFVGQATELTADGVKRCPQPH